ncbi:MAG: DNA polymerase I [Actinobacteria bacterium]|uniref:DNA-directed DNA polymerase n=1 Tax=freshwater metagenome TaxID=449393 RepID=A0A6J6CHM2_9ZZZZ|nr:DNA polymerase I [Actinomycetota bacterium]
MSQNLLLLDGHSLAYRAFHALPIENFTTSSGQPTNALYGFTSMLLNLLRDNNPSHVAVAFDVSRKTFRSEKFPEYKATRSKTPDEFRSQMDLLHEIIEALGITHIERAGYEADDVIATLTKLATKEGFTVEICSGDRDSFQLVSSDVTVLYPKKGVSELARMTPDAVLEKYGLTPEQYPDFAALRGDPSDNLPSVPGVGEKTATKWIAEYGSLSTLIAKVDQVPGKVGESLRAHISQVLLNRELTQLDHDVPISQRPADLIRQPINQQKIRELFDLLEFRTLKDRLPKDEAAAALTGEGGKSAQPTAKTFKSLGKIGDLDDLNSIAICSSDDLTRIGVAQKSFAFEISLEEAEAFLTASKAPKIFFDGKLLLRTINQPVPNFIGDVAMMAYLLNPGARTPELSEVIARYLNKDGSGQAVTSSALELDFAAASITSANVLAERAQDLLALFPILTAQCAEAGLTEVLQKIEIPTITLLAQMEALGIALEERAAAELESYFAEQALQAAKIAFDAVGREFNLASPKQLQEILFEQLKLPKTKKIKTGFTTDADALNWLMETTGHPVLAAILRSRDVTKLKSVIEGLRRAVGSDGRVHTTFQQMVTATGRLSSTDPNLQNIPIRTEEGRRIRDLFIAGSGFESLMTADYSQIELRIMAHLSEDQALLNAFAAGEDLHTTVGAEVFGVKASEVDADMRRTVKAMSYGLAYGLSAFGLSQQLDISPSQAQALMDKYFLRFGGIRQYLESVVTVARKRGYTETIFGRKRYLPDLTSDNRMRREMAERMALNAPIQGSAADIMKIAMLAVAHEISAQKLKSRILLQVHDELVLEVAPGEREPLEGIVRDQMGKAYPLKAPLSVNIGVGKSWDLAAH